MLKSHDRPLKTRPAQPERAFGARETAAWRAPSADRFDSRPANDWGTQANPTVGQPVSYLAEVQEVEGEAFPRWIIVAAGALLAAILGAFLGGAMHI